jgi:transcription-repair coupling factor (superfamily II helicase)
VRPVRVDAQVDAHVPADYVPLEAIKIDLHRRLALAGDISELRELRADVADRFGPLPAAVDNLFAIQEARLAASELGIEVVSLRGGKVTVSPVTMSSSDVRELKQRLPRALYTVASHEVSCKLDPEPGEERIRMRQALEVLATLADIRRAVAA